MKPNPFLFSLASLLLPLTVLAQPADVSQDTLAQTFKRFDANNDGVLSVDEAPQAQTFRVADTNNDAQVTLQEFRDFSGGRRPKRGALNPDQPSVTTIHPSLPSKQRANYELAANYSKERNGFSLLITVNDRVVFEQYHRGFTPNDAYRLASGTKSFWGPLALIAQHEGLLTLDETVADTLTEWRSHPRKSKITVRHLLTFTSGLDPDNGTLRGPGAADKFAHALTVKSKHPPGAKFEYGAAHLFAFGEFLSRKLKGANQDPDPLAYLHEKILDPIGLEVDSWARDEAGNPNMPFGAFLTARQWQKFGRLILHNGKHNNQQLIPADTLPQCFVGTDANPRYGLNWWLTDTPPSPNNSKLPRDVVSANGAGTQRLIVIPSLNMTIVRQAEDTKFNNNVFLSLLLNGQPLNNPQQPTTR